MAEHDWQPDVRRTAATIAAQAIAQSNRSLREIAALANVSVSTLQRARDPQSTADIGLGVLWRITAACGTSFDITPRPLYDPTAAEAAKPHPHRDAHTQWWTHRYEALTPTDVIATAAHAAAPQNASGAMLLASVRGPLTFGRLASAGHTSTKRWALSGSVTPPAHPLALQTAVGGTAVLWTEADTRDIVQLLADTTRIVKPLAAAHCVIAPGTPELFDRADTTHGPLHWADSIQQEIDAAALTPQKNGVVR